MHRTEIAAQLPEFIPGLNLELWNRKQNGGLQETDRILDMLQNGHEVGRDRAVERSAYSRCCDLGIIICETLRYYPRNHP
jgi:hypothetical protein